jgi:hypothetical protein
LRALNLGHLRVDLDLSRPKPASTLKKAWDRAEGLGTALEIAVFSVISTNFLTVGNGFEVLRLSVEIGLLAVALTPVIVTVGGPPGEVGAVQVPHRARAPGHGARRSAARVRGRVGSEAAEATNNAKEGGGKR